MNATHWSTTPEQSELATNIQDLLENTARNFILVTAGLFILWLATIGWDLSKASAYLAIIGVFTSAWAISYWLIPKSLLLSQIVLHAGALVIINMLAIAYKQPQIAYLLALLPLTATVMFRWAAGLAMEAVIGLWLWQNHQLSKNLLISPTDQWMILICGSVAIVVGWTMTKTLLTTTQWAMQGFDQARSSRDEARQHRGQLSVALKDLDLAYYRLERANASLVAARQSAEEAERFKTEFVTNVSHELRTPLNLIVGFSEVMLTAPESYSGVKLPPAYRGDLNAICMNAQHLLSLVDDVLDLARIEVGRIALKRSETNLITLAHETTDMVQDYVSAKGLKLQVDVDANLPSLWIDGVRIRQVLLNLLVNAARFTEYGSISLEIKLLDNDVMVRITDTGRGIPPQDLPKVFQEFRTTEQPTSTWHSGTGLGLPISKKFVELHHGQMGVESEVKRGTTFWFTLPVRPVQITVSENTHSASFRGQERPVVALGSTERILVVIHDDANVIHLLQRYLEGFQLIGATTPDEGCRLAYEMEAVAVLSSAPMDAHSLYKGLYIQCPLPSKRLVAVTLGADELLVKPVSQTELLAVVNRLEITPKRVLIADDNLEVVRLFRRMLMTLPQKVECIEAYNGEDALQLIQTTRPDLILLDLLMPKISGQDILKKLEADPALASIPTILVSAKTQDYETLPLVGPFQVQQANGFHLGDVVQVIDGVLNALAPGWRHLEASNSTRSVN